MKPKEVEGKQWAPTPEELNYRFRYDALSGLLYLKNPASRKTKIGEICGTRTYAGYVQVSINNKHFLAHRVIWAMVYGAWPKGSLDHINGVRDDNTLTNLRAATCSENVWNQRVNKRNKSGVKGVYWAAKSKKWQAAMNVGGKFYNIGLFKALADAEAATRAAREKLHGQFARHV